MAALSLAVLPTARCPKPLLDHEALIEKLFIEKV
jgi:hypothetical protein